MRRLPSPPTLRRYALAGLVALAGGCGGPGGTGPDSPLLGTLALEVTGLPTGLPARITLTGPDGFRRALAAGERLTGLSPGVYTATALFVTDPTRAFLPGSASDSTQVAPGVTSRLVVAYAAAPLPTKNVGVPSIFLAQSTQRDDGTVPLIQGRDAYLRVFVVANEANADAPPVRVRVLRGGVPTDSLTITAPSGSVPTAVAADVLGTSWNVLLPGAWIQPGLALQVEVDPDDLLLEATNADNRFPASGAVAVDVRAVSPLALRLVPVRQSSDGSLGDATDTGRFLDLPRSMFPFGTVTVSVRSPYTTNAPVLQSGNGNGAWGQILSEVGALRNTDQSSEHYYGVVRVSYGSGVAGIGYIGAPASLGWDKASSAGNVATHELGHNFGRPHSPCGVSGDPAYPYAGGKIGTYGLDVPALRLKLPATHADVMSYCNPTWASDHTYMAVFDYRAARAGVAMPPGAGQGAVPSVLVWGRVTPDGIVLEPPVALTARPRLPERPGSLRLRGEDRGGAPLFDLVFEGEEVADLPGGSERHFAFVLPLSGADRLASLRMAAPGQPAVERSGAAAAAPPAFRAERRPGGLELSWNPAAHPLVMVRDAETGEVLAFARGGRTTVAAVGAEVELVFADGLRSAVRRIRR